MKPIGTYFPTGLPASPPARIIATPATPVSALPPIGPNPRLRLDPALGLVVMELLDSAGKVARSAPTEAQLQAYRRTRRGMGFTP